MLMKADISVARSLPRLFLMAGGWRTIAFSLDQIGAKGFPNSFEKCYSTDSAADN